jgi:segregation and condensation protein A
MAAILAEIKSRMLLPQQIHTEDPEADPRALLVRRLQEYERYKQAAEALDQLEREERDTFLIEVGTDTISVDKPLPTVQLPDLIHALIDELNTNHRIQLDALSVREKMTYIIERIQNKEHFLFTALFNLEEGRLGLVVTFLAMLELLKQGMIEFIQAEAFAPIYLQTK